MACCGVHDEVDPRQWEAVLWARFVYVSEVDTESPLSICFFDEHDVSQPLRILYLPDYSYLEEFADLSLMAFCLSGAKLLRFCLTGLKDGLVFSL